jgi:diketogulonate reductase-like aldo/keto reductase
LKALSILGLHSFIPRSSMAQPSERILSRKIPVSGEMLPSIGLGTWQTFDVGNSDGERNPLKEVLKKLTEHGGTVVDSSPMYGRSEAVVGEISSALKLNQQLFMATKVWTSGKAAGIQQMAASFRLLQRSQIDLMQIHNLVDWQVHLKTLRQMKSEGKIRYIGLTHYTDSAHETLADIIKTNVVDFVQVNYNVMDRHAEQKLLPMAMDKGVAVLINRPFAEGALFDRVRGKSLPPEAKEYGCSSWGQFFLKFILSHPAVTCAIPGTSKPHHMIDNLQAGFGALPNASQREQMVKAVFG